MFKAFILSRSAAAILAASAALTMAGSANAASITGNILTQYSFENASTTNTGTAGGPVASDGGTVAGNATALHASAATVYSNPAGNGSAKSFSSNTWAVGDYYQMTTNTTGVTGVQIIFDQAGSATGPRDFKVSYSTNGTTFLDLTGGSYQVALSAFSATVSSEQATTPPRFLFSGGGVFDNVPSLTIRLVDTSTTAINGTTVATAGTDRIDNFTVGTNLSPTPEPGSLGLIAVGSSTVILCRRRSAVKI